MRRSKTEVMRNAARTKRSGSTVRRKRTASRLRNVPRDSFRRMKAFSIWANRTDIKDTVQFSMELRARTEYGNDAT